MTRRTKILTAVLAVVLAAGAVAWWFVPTNSPQSVAARYVEATGGDLTGLQATTLPDRGTSVAEILKSTKGAQRAAPVQVTGTQDEPAPSPVRYVVVTGTSAGRPFTVGVTLHPQFRELTWRVNSEWAP